MTANRTTGRYARLPKTFTKLQRHRYTVFRRYGVDKPRALEMAKLEFISLKEAARRVMGGNGACETGKSNRGGSPARV